jgi:curved DNA-binding protein CbpA
MKDFHEQTYYELLDISRSASQEEILKAYNRARSTYGNNSPALYSLFNKEEAQELLKLIDEAYNVLSNPFKRKKYDLDASSVLSEDMAIPPTHDLDFSSPENISSENTNEILGFSEPNISEVDDSKKRRKEDSPSIPEVGEAKIDVPGLGITIFSRFKTDDSLEEQIKSCESFSGEMINRIRLYKNVTLDQISEMTKVSRAYLVALESDNYGSLPAPVFIRGFLVQISKILNLDSSKVASSYLKLMKERTKK